MSVPIEVRQKVQAGAAWLDEHVPHGWWWRIDRAQLDMSNSIDCVLGQIFGNFGMAPIPSDETFTRGFNVSPWLFDRERRRQELADGWRELIGERLAADERRQS